MQKIVPHLWYDNQAKEAAEFYISIFDDSRLVSSTIIGDTPSGDAEILSFELEGQMFSAISAGPMFQLNPSITFMVACSSAQEVDDKWSKLAEGGTVLMALDAYPFSKRYGWIQDRFGLGWQLIYMEGAQPEQKITPCFLFSGEAAGKTQEAIEYYEQVFSGSSRGRISFYNPGDVPNPKARVMYADFKLCNLPFSAMDNAYEVDFTFNEAFSLMISCEDQEEIDYFWDKLSAVPEAEACGWVKDQFGVSWQIVPAHMDEVMFNGTPEEIQRVTEAFLKMKKFDLAALERARQGKD